MDGFLKLKESCIIVLPAIFKLSCAYGASHLGMNEKSDLPSDVFEKRELIVKASVLSIDYSI